MTRISVGTRWHSIAAFLALACAMALGACSPDAGTTPPPPPPSPTGGWLTVQLNTPRSDDGAVQFQISGPSLDSATVIQYDGFAALDGNVANLIVTGNVASGTVARIHVSDVSRATEYRASVIAAADRNAFALQDITNYHALLVR